MKNGNKTKIQIRWRGKPNQRKMGFMFHVNAPNRIPKIKPEWIASRKRGQANKNIIIICLGMSYKLKLAEKESKKEKALAVDQEKMEQHDPSKSPMIH